MPLKGTGMFASAGQCGAWRRCSSDSAVGEGGLQCEVRPPISSQNEVVVPDHLIHEAGGEEEFPCGETLAPPQPPSKSLQLTPIVHKFHSQFNCCLHDASSVPFSPVHVWTVPFSWVTPKQPPPVPLSPRTNAKFHSRQHDPVKGLSNSDCVSVEARGKGA